MPSSRIAPAFFKTVTAQNPTYLTPNQKLLPWPGSALAGDRARLRRGCELGDSVRRLIRALPVAVHTAPFFQHFAIQGFDRCRFAVVAVQFPQMRMSVVQR